MAGDPFYQAPDPSSPPPPVTPADGPSSPPGYAMVTPHGPGTSWYDIQANLDAVQAQVTGAFDAANALTGAGVLYPAGPRQAAARELMDSPQGFNSGGGLTGYDITQGWSGEPDESWDNLPQAAAVLETPIQGQPSYPTENTYQPGLQKYGTS